MSGARKALECPLRGCDWSWQVRVPKDSEPSLLGFLSHVTEFGDSIKDLSEGVKAFEEHTEAHTRSDYIHEISKLKAENKRLSAIAKRHGRQM